MKPQSYSDESQEEPRRVCGYAMPQMLIWFALGVSARPSRHTLLNLLTWYGDRDNDPVLSVVITVGLFLPLSLHALTS